MLKKLIFAGSFCILTMLASCGNKENSDEKPLLDPNSVKVTGVRVTPAEPKEDTVADAQKFTTEPKVRTFKEEKSEETGNLRYDAVVSGAKKDK